MSERAVVLKDPLDVFIQRYNNLPNRQSLYRWSFILIHSDWQVLRKMKSMLEPFKSITKKFDANNAEFSDIVANLHSLYRDLTNLHTHYSTAYENLGLKFHGL
jgi:septation ring formation regulator EzrA